MTDDIYVYVVEIPGNVNEMVTPCADGYTIYINEQLSDEGRIAAYDHAVSHLEDFAIDANADLLESIRHCKY